MRLAGCHNIPSFPLDGTPHPLFFFYVKNDVSLRWPVVLQGCLQDYLQDYLQDCFGGGALQMRC